MNNVLLIAVALAAAAALGAFLIGVSMPGLVSWVRRRRGPVEEVDEAATPTALLQSLSRPFEGLAQRQQRRAALAGSTTLTEELSRAGIKIKGPEWLAIQAVVALLIGAICLIRFGVNFQGILITVVGAVLGWFAPRLYLGFARRRRMNLFHEQLVDTINVLASSLKAGHSLPQAMDMVATTGLPPISEEFARVMHELDVGSPLDTALENMVHRIRSEDMEIIATAAIIHHHAGGNLASTLDSISETIRDRIRVRGEISAMTAQARASALFITLLPVALFVLLLFLDRGYFDALFNSGFIAVIVFGYCVGSILVGNYIIRRIVNVEV
jgi:tight adherence protein B